MQRDPLRYRIPVLGDLNGWGEHLIHFVPAKAIEKFLPAVDGPWNRGRFDAPLRHIAESLALQPLKRLYRRSPAAGVNAVKFPGFRLVDNGEQVAANSIPHRPHNR